MERSVVGIINGIFLEEIILFITYIECSNVLTTVKFRQRYVGELVHTTTIFEGGGHWGGLNTATPQKILPNTASPQEKSVDHRHRNIYFQFDDFSVSIVQDKAFKILPLTLKKSLKQHITRPKL